MVTITQYLEDVYQSFRSYLLTNPALCAHKGLNFDNGLIPDYNDVHIQEHYILRYSFAYAFEYLRMYLKVLPTHKLFQDEATYKVLSLGCGNAVDYWSVANAVEDLRLTSRIDYTGVDQVIWSHLVSKREKDSFRYIHDDIVRFLSTINDFDYDIVFFPKSISEFSNREFEILVDLFRGFKYNKKNLIVMGSFRAMTHNLEADQNRFTSVVNAIKNKKSKFDDKASFPMVFLRGKDNVALYSQDGRFFFPSEAFTTIQRLHTYCRTFKRNGVTCKSCERPLNRSSVLRSTYIRCGIACLEKKEGSN